MLRHIADAQRIAQVRLVGAVFQQGRVIRNAPERQRIHGTAFGKLLEHAGNDRLDGVEHVLLRDKAHLEIELIELARRTVGTRGFVAEAGRDLEVAIEPRHHRQLLELLRRLRQRVELARMQPRRHQEGARALGAICGQDRRLEFGEAGLDHPPADRGDHPGAQHDIPLQLLPPQVQVAISQPDVLRELLIAGHLHRQHIGRRLHRQFGDPQLDLAGRQPGVHRAWLAVHHLAGDGDHAFRSHRIGGGKRRGAGREHALGDAVMITQVDEQQPAVVALGVHPARQAGGLPGVCRRAARRRYGCDRGAWWPADKPCRLWQVKAPTCPPLPGRRLSCSLRPE